MTVVFSKEWFKKHNEKLCWVANSFIGDFIFKISKMGHDKKKYGKITEMHPNAITHKQRLLYNFETKKTEQEYTTQFFGRNEYALRLQKVFYPIWLLFHCWDMLVANRFKPAWNLGFDTLTVYPDAGTGNTTVDGYKGCYVSQNTWSTLVGLASGTEGSSTTTSDDIMSEQQGTSSNRWIRLRRALYTLDTSDLTSNADISAVVFSLYPTAKGDSNSAAPTIDVYAASPASDNVLVNGDYSQVSSTTQTGSPIAYANIITGQYLDFTFDIVGRLNINKTGITRLGTRNANYDVADTQPNWVGNSGYWVQANFADNATNKPKLVVTYTISVVAPTVTTQAATAVEQTTCTGNGNITATGGANATRRGFCYMEGTSGDPTTANSVAYDDGSFGTGAYTKGITGLSAGTGYRVRAYAVNSAGTGYGNTVQVDTLSASADNSIFFGCNF